MTVRLTRTFPGLQTPAASWEQPFDMLRACHERVFRMLELLEKLQAHVAQHGADANAAQAATDVMRYFDQAAPLHHLDEEEQVFPIALAQGSGAVQAAVMALLYDHGAMAEDWASLRAALQAWTDPAAAQALRSPQSSQTLALIAFADRYRAHIAVEESVVYPCVEALLAPQALEAMGRAMGQRRGAASPNGVLLSSKPKGLRSAGLK